MQITCKKTLNQHPNAGAAEIIWSFIASADKLSCVLDGDAIQVAAIKGVDEIPLSDIGIGTWRNREALGEILAGFGSISGVHYGARLRMFAQKPIEWLGEEVTP